MEQLEQELKVPDIKYRPELRWWMAAGYHTDETLRFEVEAAHRLGFGGMEFLAMDERNVDMTRYGWGSEEWVHDSQLVVEETTKRGMAVSFTSGANWSNANVPTITPEHEAAAKELDFVFEDLKGGQKRTGKLPQVDLDNMKGGHALFPTAKVSTQSFVAVVAAHLEGILLGDTINLTERVREDSLDWEAPEGNWRLFVFWMHGTGQIATPSCSVNYTVNYLERAGSQAVIDYWKDVILTPDFKSALSPNQRAQMYMDSLELTTVGAGGLFWGHTVEQEFRQRRGYSVIPYLPLLVQHSGLNQASAHYLYESQDPNISKVRHDLLETYTDLYIENMLRPFRAFLHQHGIGLRAEISYGLPFELTRPGIEVDGVENESLEFGSQIDAYRLMAGVAHLHGKQYSSETGANTRNCMLPHSFYDQIINTQLAAGITKTVLHGWASMAGGEGTTWPGHQGMIPFFSERFDTRQPGSEFYPLWCNAIGRKQLLLRRGKPRIDVGILRTDHATDNLSGLTFRKDGYRVPDEVAYGSWWMRNRENFWWQDLGMQDSGWTYEFFDGSLLLEGVKMDKVVQPDGPGYQALIVYQSSLNPNVAKLLLQWAKDGLPILLVHNTRELLYHLEDRYATHSKAAGYTPGLDGRDEELKQTIKELLSLSNTAEIDDQSQTVTALRSLGVQGRAEFDNQNILTHLREDGDLLHLFVYHFLYEGKSTEVEIGMDGVGCVYQQDLWKGTTSPLVAVQRKGRTFVKLSLRPGESTIITLDKKARPSTISDKPKIIATLNEWELSVESWSAGEVEKITEDRGLGYVTVEDRPHVKKTIIDVGRTALKSWRDIPSVGSEISGVGEYSTWINVEHPEGHYVLDLGSTCGGLGAVSINSSQPIGFDTSVPKVDISGLLNRGKNQINVRVSTSLNNRLIADKFYKPDPLKDLVGAEWRPGEDWLIVRDYGLIGPVTLSLS